MNGQAFKIKLLDVGTRMTCEEAECQQYRNGWVTTLDESTGEHAQLAQWIRKESKRGYIECRSEDAGTYLDGQGMNFPPGLRVFIFHAGQTCFRPHKDREVVFQHQRGFLEPRKFIPTSAPRIHTRPQDFNEHMNESVYKLERMAQSG